MLLKNYQILFIVFLTMGTVIAVSSNSWFTAWMGLELNLMSFIPLFIYKMNSTSIESCVKYFLPQAMASVIIIMYAVMDLTLSSYSMISIMHVLLVAALLIKLGLPPFHFWFPQIMNKLSWNLCVIMITWQKVAPFILISSIMTNEILPLMITASVFIGALGGFNQNLTKLIATYSSISHGAWMLPLASFSLHNWMLYFALYSFVSLSLMYLMKMYNLLKISNFSYTYIPNTPKMAFSMTLMSLGGLPPLLGFTAKLNAMIVLVNFTSALTLIILISGSLVSLFYYMKLIYSILTIYPNKPLKSLKLSPTSSILNTMISLSILGNLVTPLLVSLT